ncbi:bifunctional UDP-N-acetylmuramoyl-tripeptide:D-alanyl-D-alanine ligase/alanine racemase [Agriterribacter sp.]|uniref:bifunctional UDP-N-acetylmuramoyl-tripeptide:D-alanyl-D-alanine ligase/alanine racemase n=1 Tax=Agriterribacter sp. TaxID=2821509 RepID=UPI002C67C946|nr:bifunctional UDP-N-acetylmuramoyl-tripeptide:D-alanyl-D-alanine ligase/alanine racemase [Agriterribacter sp.]HRO44340.1 bifunctional UDP-N-acetylmuramoyl-tripeptide:D-alanyl-D-alanine ligase/alanine racemase [Agriterribacter sp.]HRQ16656.1 bifunctional UDP-N-acetylmuramoyl-tripeptide:D-alanyl-D-alanine ligase/alanine racemase [Agriterribacter sp.]
MGNYTIEKISAIVHAQLQSGGDSGTVIDYLLTDSRRVVHAASSLFFALPGPRRNGHLFIPELYARGIKNFVADLSFETKDYPNANFIRVVNVLAALQTLVAFHRSQFGIPVVGITGSNGKTIVKEWLNQLLEKDYQIVRSPKSYNSQTGVPLSVWQMNLVHTLGIFEAGISQPGEMEALQKIIQPTIGVLTHMGDAHSENFKDQQQKIREKLLLFTGVNRMIANGDDPLIVEAVEASGIPCLFWGKQAHCAIRVVNIKKEEAHTTIRLEVNREAAVSSPLTSLNLPLTTYHLPLIIRIPFTDNAAVENAITCGSVLLTMGYSRETITEHTGLLKPVEMRLEMKKGINNCSVINDSYIADTSSLRIALDFLEQQHQHRKRTVILSDFAETKDPAKLYSEIALALQHKNINRFIGIGAHLQEYKNKFEQAVAETSFYNSTEDFITHLHGTRFHDETILIKGARKFALERISALLEQKAHQTVLEVNLTAIVHNLKQYQQLLQPSTKIMAMVKAFSYGSGSYEIANMLQFHKVDYLAVAYADEGVELRKSGISLPIMVMNPEESSYHAITENNLEPEIFSFNVLSSFRNFLQEQGLQNYPVHIKIDTGMHRLGFEPSEITALAKALADHNLFAVQSVFSHLAGSEDSALDAFTRQQAGQYIQACSILQQALAYPFIRHIANSAAIIRHPQLHFDMVRLGIGLYGINSSASDTLELREAATLKTTIAQIKKIKAGETVGYTRKGTLQRDSIIATIRIGYADGYRRNLSNGAGSVLVNGKLAPVTGNIAMDMTMIDITDIPGAREGDDVIVFGKGLSITQLAQWAQTIPYEIMTGISQRVLRVYYEE